MLLKPNNKITLLFFLASLLACKETKQKPKEIIVAEVGEAKLTEKQLNGYLKENNSEQLKEEFIRQWVETEVLYQTAEEEGILTQENYNNIINVSAKKLAASLAIENYLKKNSAVISEKKLKDFYEKNKNNFQLPVEAFILNYISFAKEEDAIKFRNKASVKGWNRAEREIKNKKSVIESYKNKLVRASQISSQKLLRVLSEQYQNEISLVIKTELNNFVVVQQTKKIEKNNVPEFKYIKKDVENLYIATQNKELARNYINKLITEKQVKIY